MSNRDRVEQLLQHYIQTVWQRAGLHWDSDNTSEIGGLVDALVGMVNDEIQEHTENAPHIYADGSTA